MNYLNEKIQQVLKYKNKVISFDIFDTLITRAFTNPQGIFLLMQEKINKYKDFDQISIILKDNFATIRENIENYTQRNQLIINKNFECTFNEIYNLLQLNYSLSNDEVSNLKKLEIECEKNNILPIYNNINILKKLKQTNKIILTSDMYYPSEILKSFLTNIDNVFEDIKIYSSADIKLRKSNGNLYRYLKDIYKNQEIIHIGDNKFSDYTQSKWNNIQSYLVQSNDLKIYEQNSLSSNYNNLILNLSIGISKYIRSTSLNEIFSFGASFTAPILYDYVDWVIKDAKKNNIEDLYFIARDGYIPKVIADIIIQQQNYSIKTHYFYSSRRATRICDENNYELFINWIFSEFQDQITLNFIAERLNIDINDIILFTKIKQINKKLHSYEKNLLKEKLLNSKDLKNIIINHNKIKKENFIHYINQEIDFSKKFAFVDINGSGRTQDNLCQLISNKIDYPIISYYFHLQPDMVQNNLSIKKAYFHNIKYINILLEILCRTIQGQTLAYKKINNKIVPILEYEENSSIKKWGYKEYLNGIIKYTEMYSKYRMINNINHNSLVFYKNFINFYKNADKETANIIGKIPFGIYGDEKNIKECAPAYNLLNIFSIKTINKYISILRIPFMYPKLARLITNIFTNTTYGYISKYQNIAYLKIYKYKINIKNLIWK